MPPRARYMRKKKANMGVKFTSRARYRRRGKTSYKKARRMLRRMPTIASPVRYTTRINLPSTSQDSINVNNLTNETGISYNVYNIVPAQIDDLTARSILYSKFKITKIKYIFKRTVPMKQTAGVNYMSIKFSGDYHVAFPNTFNRLLPEATSTNADALLKWGQQQTNSKKFNLSTMTFTKSVAPLVVENTTYQGPSGVTLGADVQVTRNRKMPWLDLNSDLLDNMSLGQLVIMNAPTDVLTTFPLGTGGSGSNGMNAFQAKECAQWDCFADVTYMVKGRFLDRAIATG